MKKKIGIFGGAFNPITKAHLKYAITAYNELNLDEVWIMPTGTHPDKILEMDPGSANRISMINEAVKNYPGIKVSTFEVDKRGISYTYQTMSELKEKMPECDFWFLLSEDRIEDFKTWDNYHIILENARIGTCLRGGMSSCHESFQEKIKQVGLEKHVDTFYMEPMNISSTDVRTRIKKGLDINHLVTQSIRNKVIELYSI